MTGKTQTNDPPPAEKSGESGRVSAAPGMFPSVHGIVCCGVTEDVLGPHVRSTEGIMNRLRGNSGVRAHGSRLCSRNAARTNFGKLPPFTTSIPARQLFPARTCLRLQFASLTVLIFCRFSRIDVVRLVHPGRCTAAADTPGSGEPQTRPGPKALGRPMSTTEWRLLQEIEADDLPVAVNLFDRNEWYHKDTRRFTAEGLIGDRWTAG